MMTHPQLAAPFANLKHDLVRSISAAWLLAGISLGAAEMCPNPGVEEAGKTPGMPAGWAPTATVQAGSWDDNVTHAVTRSPNHLITLSLSDTAE